MRVGIVGAEAAKFTEVTEAAARVLIQRLLYTATAAISGGCHLGGIDIWVEEEASRFSFGATVFKPLSQNWLHYRARNIQIAEASDVVHCITLRELPPGYTGMRFSKCYHCNSTSHVKSGGCWTTRYAERQLGKAANLHIISPDGSVESAW